MGKTFLNSQIEKLNYPLNALNTAERGKTEWAV